MPEPRGFGIAFLSENVYNNREEGGGSMRKERPIAVFDSGLGGISVLRELVRQMPQENYLYFGDSLHAPYGSRPTQEIRDLTFAAAERLFAQDAKALVIACNTATSAAVDELRAAYPERIIIGIEPALKLAVSRHPGGRILVMATEATLREKKFALLMEHFGADCEILKCPCPELVEFVERGELTGPAVEASLRAYLKDCTAMPLDAAVLGCTHYPFLRPLIRKVLGPQTDLLDGADGTARETRRRLSDAGLLRRTGKGSVEMTNSLGSAEILERSEALLKAKTLDEI